MKREREEELTHLALEMPNAHDLTVHVNVCELGAPQRRVVVFAQRVRRRKVLLDEQKQIVPVCGKARSEQEIAANQSQLTSQVENGFGARRSLLRHQNHLELAASSQLTD